MSDGTSVNHWQTLHYFIPAWVSLHWNQHSSEVKNNVKYIFSDLDNAIGSM